VTRATLLRRLVEAPPGGQSAVIAEARVILGSLAAVYALLDAPQNPGRDAA
jgi:hypothetical protein